MNKKTYIYKPKITNHPGRTLRGKLDEIYMSIKTLSLITDIDYDTLENICNCNESITIEIANELERVLKIPSNFWMNYQKGYDNFINKNQ